MMKITTGGLSALFVLGASLVLGGSPPVATAQPAGHSTPVDLAVFSNKVTASAGHYSGSFAGVYVDQGNRTVHLELKGGTQTKAATLAAEKVGDTAKLEIDNVRFSLADLTATAKEITANTKGLAAEGIQVRKVAIDETTNGLTVGLNPGSVKDSLSLLQERFPQIPINVQYIKILSAASLDYGSGPPWPTGMELYKLFYQGSGLYYTACTAGFNVVNPSTKQSYVTTAAHCFDTGDQVLHSTGSVGQNVGEVTQSAGFGSTADVELITPSDDDVPNTAIVNNSTDVTVTGYYPTTNVGVSLCKSGITTGETCGNVVVSTDATVCYSSGCFYNQEETQNSSINEVAYYGDSGGPVYLYNGSGSINAAGSLSGFEEVCGASGSDCSLDGVMFFTPIQNMENALGVVP